MAKVTITIQDGEEPSEVKLSMDFDPEVKPNDECTPAQQFAFHVMSTAQREMGT